MINWIQHWYDSKCDGDWEHNYGIKIETLDNPGWNVKIDFNSTGLEIRDIAWKLYEVSDDNWIGYSVTDNVFSSSGDPLKLDIILMIFKRIIENDELTDKIINELLV